MIKIGIPDYCQQEIHYVLNLIFDYFWGIEFITEQTDKDEFQIITEKGSIHMPSIFFNQYAKNGLNRVVLPNEPIFMSDNLIFDNKPVVGNKKIPVIYGYQTANILKTESNNYFIAIDIPGSIFFMLTRFEEYVVIDRDSHDRFLATSSVAYRNNFLNRPIVNEYMEILWFLIKLLLPDIKRKKRQFSLEPVHDVDVPFLVFNQPVALILRNSFSDMVTRRQISIAWEQLKGGICARKGKYSADPYFSFDYIMDESEKRNIRSTFYFIATNSPNTLDGIYSLNDPEIRDLLKTIHKRGHRLGLHPSYQANLDGEKLLKECQNLRSVCIDLGIETEINDSRQHYLRFSVPATFHILEQSNIKFDSTLTFADKPGFRCGICYEFPVFDLYEGKKMNIFEKPLIAMDNSLLLRRYGGKGPSREVLQTLAELKKECQKFNGRFSLLWHNSQLAYKKERHLYEKVLDV